MSALQYLAFDVGAESGRACIGAFDGLRLRIEEVHRFSNRPVWVGEHLHWNVLGLFAEIQNALTASSSGFETELARANLWTRAVNMTNGS